MTFIEQTGYGHCVSVSDSCRVPWRISVLKEEGGHDLFSFYNRRFGLAKDPSGRERRDVPPRIRARAKRAMERAGYVIVA